jgi:hypothetical protein
MRDTVHILPPVAISDIEPCVLEPMGTGEPVRTDLLCSISLLLPIHSGAFGSVCYKPEGRGFDSR